MKKTWWWRVVITIVSILFMLMLYITSCSYEFSRCFWGNDVITKTAFHIDLAIVVISLFLFSINDKVFLKWLRFAVVWIALSVFAVAATPGPHEGLLSFGGPSKEMVSIWMGSLFVILSLGKIAWDAKQEKGNIIQDN